MTAAEHHAGDRTAVDVDIGAIDVGSITSAIDIADGGVALVDDVHLGCTHHVAGIATAIDIAADGGHVALMARRVVANGHFRVTRHLTLGVVVGVTLTTTIDILGNGTVQDVDLQSLTTGNGVSCQVTRSEDAAEVVLPAIK